MFFLSVAGGERRRTLNVGDKCVRYALIVSIRVPEAEVDIYTPVANAIGTQVQIEA